MPRYQVLRDCRLASGARYRTGDEAALRPGAAKYPLLRGWIAPVPAPPPAEDGPREPSAPPSGRARRRGR